MPKQGNVRSEAELRLRYLLGADASPSDKLSRKDEFFWLIETVLLENEDRIRYWVKRTIFFGADCAEGIDEGIEMLSAAVYVHLEQQQAGEAQRDAHRLNPQIELISYIAVLARSLNIPAQLRGRYAMNVPSRRGIAEFQKNFTNSLRQNFTVDLTNRIVAMGTSHPRLQQINPPGQVDRYLVGKGLAEQLASDALKVLTGTKAKLESRLVKQIRSLGITRDMLRMPFIESTTAASSLDSSSVEKLVDDALWGMENLVFASKMDQQDEETEKDYLYGVDIHSHSDFDERAALEKSLKTLSLKDRLLILLHARTFDTPEQFLSLAKKLGIDDEPTIDLELLADKVGDELSREKTKKPFDETVLARLINLKVSTILKKLCQIRKALGLHDEGDEAFT